MENTVITMEQLEHSPSYKHGYKPKFERDVRILCCRFIESATILLRLPQITAATAQVLLHRFFFVESIGSLPLLDVIGACMYLASKLEESPRRLREILTVLDYLYKRSENLPDAPLDISHPSYYDKRDGLLRAEIQILAKLSFNVHVEHPHGFMMNYLSALGLSDHPRIPQLALNYLNDSLCTIVHVLYQPQVIAVGVVFLAARVCNYPLPVQPPWYEVFDAELADLELISCLILEIYEIKSKLNRIPKEMKL